MRLQKGDVYEKVTDCHHSEHCFHYDADNDYSSCVVVVCDNTKLIIQKPLIISEFISGFYLRLVLSVPLTLF